jgi:hypothetical protein
MTSPRPVLLALAASVGLALALPSLPATADDKAPPAAADPDAPPYLPDQERVELTAPPMRIDNPGNGWILLDVDKLKEKAKAARQDVSGYERLKVRLWHPATKADIFVDAWFDQVSRAAPLTVEQYGQPLLEGVKTALQEAEVKGTGGTKIGGREGWMFEVHGKSGANARAVVKAVTFRPEDKVVVSITLECPADRAAALKRDLTKVLRKARV